MVNMNRKCI